MDTTERTEARIEDAGHTLVAPSTPGGDDPVRDFFGSTITPEDLTSGTHDLTGGTVYLTGDVGAIFDRRLPNIEPQLRELFGKLQAKHGTG